MSSFQLLFIKAQTLEDKIIVSSSILPSLAQVWVWFPTQEVWVPFTQKYAGQNLHVL